MRPYSHAPRFPVGAACAADAARVDEDIDPYKPSKKRNAPAFAAAFLGGEFALRQIAQKWKPMAEYSWSMGGLLCYHASQKKKKVCASEKN